MTPTPTDWAYLAGLIDGEGTFIRRCEKRLCRLRIAMNSEDVIAALPGRFGAGTSIPTKPYTIHERTRFPWAWSVNSARDLIRVIEGTLPYLIVKRPQAERVLEFARLCRYTGPSDALRVEAFDMLHDLNH